MGMDAMHAMQEITILVLWNIFYRSPIRHFVFYINRIPTRDKLSMHTNKTDGIWSLDPLLIFFFLFGNCVSKYAIYIIDQSTKP